jgi:CYTH domain-containing protein
MAIPIECERRFLVSGDEWRALIRRSQHIRQGYIATDDDVTVRVRQVESTSAYLTIKMPHKGEARVELEYEIPADHANFLIQTACAERMVEKTRHDLTVEGVQWTVDEFSGGNQGLIIAEVELDCMERPVPLPRWIGQEVTGVDRFHNSHLAHTPFAVWDELKRA